MLSCVRRVRTDFNSPFDDSCPSIDHKPLASLLGEGEGGSPFAMHDALPPSGGPTHGAWTEIGEAPGMACAVDHVLLGATLRAALLRPVLDAEESDHVLASGLPTVEHPSDHLPLALVVEPAREHA